MRNKTHLRERCQPKDEIGPSKSPEQHIVVGVSVIGISTRIRIRTRVHITITITITAIGNRRSVANIIVALVLAAAAAATANVAARFGGRIHGRETGKGGGYAIWVFRLECGILFEGQQMVDLVAEEEQAEVGAGLQQRRPPF